MTYRAIQRLIDEDFLSSRREKSGSITFVLVWRRNVRYVERPIKAHLDLATEYAEETVSKAVGRYAETLVSFGLRALGLQIHSRNTNKYNGKAWSKSQHDLDFIVEGPNAAYGVEVKNTFDYMPMNEFSIKLDMCNELGLIPLFIVRSRDSIQWRDTRERHGLIYMFKSKIFPPGYDDLVSRMWQDMRLPVTIWDDWRPSFYDTLSSFLQRGNTS
ncbi:MAG: hypothetical protein IH957_03545 [Chloroflexi bacterium]|nr:hypothetical protein [Chloroflexota bacterium]